MRSRRKGLLAIAALTVLVLAVAGFVFCLIDRTPDSENLALQRGVTARADSAENEELTAPKVIDGNDQDRSSRWSSENNWEDANHYIELEFPEEISVSFVILKWERRNAVHYALEGSTDGEKYTVLEEFKSAPAEKNQEIALEQPSTLRYLRLSVYEVSQKEEDYSNLYQNVSLYEIEVYQEKPAAYLLEAPTIETTETGGRRLVMPKAPEGCQSEFLGADYEQVIGADGTVYDTIQEKEVTVGFLVTDREGEQRERAFTITVPAKQQVEMMETEAPTVIPALAEWSGHEGVFALSENSRILLDFSNGEEESLRNLGELLARELGESQAAMLPAKEWESRITQGKAEDAQAGDIVLGFAAQTNGLGEEGYTIQITDKFVINAEQIIGLRWGTVTLRQLYDRYGENIPQGEIRDYPLYEVRGFGIDVARKAVSLEMLTAMMETMSYYKMNDFGLHLNDNVILATSGLDDSVKNALTAESAFRLESEIQNEEGDTLTSEEYSYTKEEINDFVQTAAVYGVQVVPEIDTPAHALAITKLFPEYALGNNPLWVDQINLDNKEATGLARDIWEEALDAQKGAFRNAGTVNIGMDEYYGDGAKYRSYLKEIAALVQEYGKKARLWGSLSNIEGSEMPGTENLELNIWSTVWADPVEMYRQGYSIINMQNNHLYIIPGGGYDYLDKEELAANWEPNRFYDHDTMETVPTYSLQMRGAAYMIWNDMSGRLDLGISEADLYDRFRDPLGVLSGKLWGAPDSIVQETALEQPEESTKLQDSDRGIVPSYTVACRVYLEKGVAQSGQILSKSDSAYGEWAFYAAEPETGKVGFCREGKTYTFDYTLPIEQWTELKIVGEPGMTTLYVDGEKIQTLGSREPFEEYATFAFPIQYLGEETGSFQGQVEWSALQRDK